MTQSKVQSTAHTLYAKDSVDVRTVIGSFTRTANVPNQTSAQEGKTNEYAVGREYQTSVSTSNGPLIGGSLPSQLSEEKSKLDESLSVLLEYLALFGFDKTGFNRDSTMNHWQLCSAECGWIKFLKYKLSAFFSAFLHDELPPAPFGVLDNPLHLVGGRAGRFISSRLKGGDSMTFALGILFLKKGLPRPGQDALDKALKSTKQILTTLHPIPKSRVHLVVHDDWTVTDKLAEIEDLEGEVIRTVQEIFRNKKFTDEDLYKPYVPSIRANYTSSRSKLGTLGDLIKMGVIYDTHHYETQKIEKSADFYGGVLEYVTGSGDDDWIEDETMPHYRVKETFVADLKEKYKTLYEIVRHHAVDELSETTLVALAEALKVRVISKGPPLKYFCLKPIQKFMHSHMRKQRVFRLIGEPATAEFIQSVFTGVSGKFLSVDYASATDLLNPRLSLAAVNEIVRICGIPSDLAQMFRDALCGHTVEGSPQLWGQLMGSIVSFPILCIVNAAICRRSYEIGEGLPWGISLAECPLLVNGDDGLLRCNAKTKETWSDLSALGGLTPSVGKVYYHDSYLNINSTSYSMIESKCTHHPYVNMGLVKGMTRSEGKMDSTLVTESDSAFGTIGSRHHELMNGCPDSIRLTVHKMFIRENYDMLKSVKVPWFVPESMGGVGLKPFTVMSSEEDVEEIKLSYLTVDGVRYGPSDLDLKCCRILINKYSHGCSVRKLPTSQPVQARQVWYTKKGFDIPSLHVLGSANSTLAACADSQSNVFSFLDLTTFYYCPSLVAKQVERKHSALRSNERAWESLTRAALSMSGLPGFEYLRSSHVYKPAFFTLP